MTISEDEAKDKWCPLVRTGLTAGMAVNHHIGGDVHDETRCIGSACMAWRWENFDRNKRVPPEGFCGAFGVPLGAK